jgi:hypothetical protein
MFKSLFLVAVHLLYARKLISISSRGAAKITLLCDPVRLQSKARLQRRGRGGGGAATHHEMEISSSHFLMDERFNVWSLEQQTDHSIYAAQASGY